MENSIEILKQLLEAGVLTQEEYEAKEKQLLSQQGEEENEDSVSVQSIDFDELRNLEELKDEGILSQDEYSRKAAQICGITLPQAESTAPAQEMGSVGTWLKKNIVALIVIVALISALGYMGSKLSSVQTENAKLSTDLESTQQKYDSMQSNYFKAKKCESAVKDFYLDTAVMVLEGDNTYHRYNCPTFPYSYTFYVYNIDNAKAQGYKKCTTCFGVDASTYINKNF